MKTRSLPDHVEAVEKVHEAAAYDKWFRSKVQEALDDPRPSISNEEAKAIFAKQRAELKARIGAKS